MYDSFVLPFMKKYEKQVQGFEKQLSQVEKQLEKATEKTMWKAEWRKLNAKRSFNLIHTSSYFYYRL